MVVQLTRTAVCKQYFVNSVVIKKQTKLKKTTLINFNLENLLKINY